MRMGNLEEVTEPGYVVRLVNGGDFPSAASMRQIVERWPDSSIVVFPTTLAS